MTIPTWPSTLPQYMDTQGFKQENGNNTIRSQPDMGPALTRKRTSAMPVEFEGSILVDKAEEAILRSFYDDDLNDGALRFNWVDQLNGDAVEVRFVEPYKLTGVSGDLFKVMMKMEIMP